MKDNVLEALTFLFERYLLGAEHPQPEVMIEDLKKQGFTEEIIERALRWLVHLQPNTLPIPAHSRACRVFHPQESARLSVGARNLLSRLEMESIITANQREQIVAGALDLDRERMVTVDTLRWVAAMVLFNQPEPHALSIAWMERLFYRSVRTVHH